MAKKIVLTAILAIALVWGMTVVGCGGGGDGPVPIIPVPQMVSYQSADTAGYTYILVITVNGSTAAAGDSYVLTIKGTGQPDKVSRGIISAIGTEGTLTLKPNTSGSGTFSVTINNGQMTAINGTIAIEGGEPVAAPGALTPEIDGWTWSTYIDRSEGGTSTITMTQGSGNDRNKLTFSGNVQRIPELTYGYAGCYVEPNSANLAALKNADSFSFKCRGDGKQYIIYVDTSDVPINSKFRKTFTASTTDNTITVQYSELVQGWDNTIPFNKNNIKGILFEAFFPGITGEGPFNITIWDLKAGGQEPGGNNNNGGGTFTLTGIPSEYNGKYALLSVSGENPAIIGAQTVNLSTDFVTLPVISNGSVSIPLWILTGSNITRYSGNHTIGVDIVISKFQSFISNPDITAEITFASVTFSNGSATRSWSQKDNNNGNNNPGTGGAPQWTATYITNNISDIRAIAYGGGKFVAVGYGVGATSTDGITWTSVSVGRCWSIAYGNNKFVAVGNDGNMRTSTDGTTWTAVSNSTFDSRDTITAIAYGNGKFVASGYDVNGGRKTATSTDGTTWTTVYRGGRGDEVIAYGNGMFVAGQYTGSISTSTNGESWSFVNHNIPFDTQKQLLTIAYCNDKFIVGGKSGIMATSTDGTTWTAVTQSVFGPGDDINAIAYGNGMFVAGGKSGKMATSTDGTTWTAVTYNTFGTRDIYAIAYGGGKFVAGGYMGSMAYLSDN